MEGVTLCSSSSFCPQGEERSRIPPEANETWKQFVYKQKTKVCRLSLPIIIYYFLFVLYNVQGEKQVILLGNSQRCHFIGSVAISLSLQRIEIALHARSYLFCFSLSTFEISLMENFRNFGFFEESDFQIKQL